MALRGEAEDVVREVAAEVKQEVADDEGVKIVDVLLEEAEEVAQDETDGEGVAVVAVL